MKCISQKGFAVVETLLIVIIVGLLAGVGYYVYHSQKTANQTYTSASKVAQSSPVKTGSNVNTNAATNSANWLLFTTPDKQYSIKLVDGWKLHCVGGYVIYSQTNEDLKPNPGVKAQVSIDSGYADGSQVGLTLNISSQIHEDQADPDDKLASFSTVQGLEVHIYKHIYTATEQQNASSDGSSPVAQIYNYYVTKPGSTRTFNAEYKLDVGATDYHALVEEALKTLTLN